jgi:Gas vesicle synthesis protein GvpL/GvpF
MTAASYTYAIARAFDPTKLAGLRGIDGAVVRLVGCDDLAAVVSSLPPAIAEPAALRARLETLAELEEIARSHHAVVEAVAACSVTLPLRLGTVHHGDNRVAELLLRRQRQLSAALDRLDGRVELGVKVYLKPAAARTRRDEPPAYGSTASGRSYLRHVRRQRDDRQHARRRAEAAARELDIVLTALAVDRRQHRAQSAQLSAGAGENLLNVAYLVDSWRMQEVVQRARLIDAQDCELSIDVTGPWPPYSFAASGERSGLDLDVREERS